MTHLLTHHVNIRIVPALSLIADLSFNGLSDGHLTRLQYAARRGEILTRTLPATNAKAKQNY